MNFWQKYNEPIICLAPMEDVTDTVFRELIMRLSDPAYLHVLFTEFTSTDGLAHTEGFERVVERLEVSNSEKGLLHQSDTKLVAQVWGTDPDKFIKAAEYISSMGLFDGIDINMGCPVKKIIKKGSCSALILDPGRAQDIIRATRSATKLPVSVKTRIGFHKKDTAAWISTLLEVEPAAIILHARTSKQQSLVPAQWGEIAVAIDVRDKLGLNTPIIGNGDVNDLVHGYHLSEESGADGFMVGRGIFHNPWIFREEAYEPSPEERLKALLQHTALYYNVWGNRKPFQVLKRFFKIYASGFPGAATLRAQLMQSNSPLEVGKIVAEYFPGLSY